MKKTLSLLVAAYFFLRYLIKSRHRKGHGVHSPFVFNFVSKVLFDKTNYREYLFFNSIISSLIASEETLPVKDLGDDSMQFSDKDRKVSDLLNISSIPSKYGKLLFRITRYYKPATIVELGTSIGVSSMYLARGNRGSKLLTVEGNKALCDFATNLFGRNNLGNISIFHGDFDQTIIDLSAEFASPQLVFIDGNHMYEPTMRYYKHFKERIKEGILIIDDIYWSEEMRRTWKEIVQQNKEYVTIDLYRMGIILVRESITSGHYVVRY